MSARRLGALARRWFADRSGAHPAVDYDGSTGILALGVTRTW